MIGVGHVPAASRVLIYIPLDDKYVCMYTVEAHGSTFVRHEVLKSEHKYWLKSDLYGDPTRSGIIMAVGTSFAALNNAVFLRHLVYVCPRMKPYAAEVSVLNCLSLNNARVSYELLVSVLSVYIYIYIYIYIHTQN